MESARLFAMHAEGPTLIVTPTGPVSNLVGYEVQPELSQLLALFQKEKCRDVLVDMEKATFFGSVLLGALNTIFRQVRQQGGKLVLCNLSGVGQEVVHVARFDTLWIVCTTREEALQALRR